MTDNNRLLITIGIPTFNSSQYLFESLNSVINCSSVNEIIISDDGSIENEIKKLEQVVSTFTKNSDKDIKLIKHSENKGAFANKLSIFEESTNDLVYLLDGDNIAGKNLDYIIQKKIKKDLGKPYLFQPGTMYQFWTKHRLSKLFSIFNKKYRVIFSKSDISLNSIDAAASLIDNPGTYDLGKILKNKNTLNSINNVERKNKNFPLEKWIMWVLNCGNFIVNKNLMLNIASAGLEFDRKINSLDAVTFSYLWLQSGNEIKLYKDFFHHHRKREDSVSFLESQNTEFAMNFFINNIVNLIKSNEE